MLISAPAFFRYFSARSLPACMGLLVLFASLMPVLSHAQIQFKLGNAPAAVSDTVVTPRVHAQLVPLAPEGIAPGKPLELGLRLQHQPEWHTYWKNAGDSGLPTQLDWQLPAGMQAGDIAWPTPQQIRVGDMLNYGYEDTVLLPVPVQVTPDFKPNADGTADIQLHASWLICRVECIPEEGQFQLRLPVEVADSLWARDFAAAHTQAPTPLPEAQAQVTVLPSGDRVALRVEGLPTAAQGQTLAFYPEAADTFVHAAELGNDWTQSWDGSVWTAELPLSDMRGTTPTELDIVLGLPAEGPALCPARLGWT